MTFPIYGKSFKIPWFQSPPTREWLMMNFRLLWTYVACWRFWPWLVIPSSWIMIIPNVLDRKYSRCGRVFQFHGPHWGTKLTLEKPMVIYNVKGKMGKENRLVVSTLWKILVSQLGLLFPIYEKIKLFQTTNQKIMINHGMDGQGGCGFPFKFRQTHVWIHYWSGLAGEYPPVNMDGNENEQRSGYYMMAQWTMMINHGVIPTAWDNVQSVQAFPNPVEKPWFLMIFVPVEELEAVRGFFPYQTCPTGKSQLQKSSVPFPGWGDPE